MDNQTIRIPVAATMRKQPDGSFEMVAAEWAEVTADSVARFLLQKFGVDAVFGGDAD